MRDVIDHAHARVNLQAYAHDGVLFPFTVLTDDELKRYRDDAIECHAALGELAATTEHPIKMNGELHLHFEWAHALSTHPAVLDVVEQIIGPNILVHSSTLFLKPPGNSYVSWHQDGHYWGLSAPHLVSAWIALANSTVENGCLRVQPGSHITLLPHIERVHPDNMLGTGSTVRDGFDEARAVDVELRAGEMSMHHVNMLHGSNPNRSRADRIGYAVRYLATDVRQSRPHHLVVLARGRDDHGHFEQLTDRPRGSVQAGLPRHLEFSRWLARSDLDHQ